MKLLGAVQQRFRTQHEDDALPVVLWFVTSHALGFVAFYISRFYFRIIGQTSTTTVMLVGGGTSTPMQWPLASYNATLVQGAVFIIAFICFCLWDYGVLSNR